MCNRLVGIKVAQQLGIGLASQASGYISHTVTAMMLDAVRGIVLVQAPQSMNTFHLTQHRQFEQHAAGRGAGVAFHG